jgi:type IV secretory pathway VirJ component
MRTLTWLAVVLLCAAHAGAQTTESLTIRGHALQVRTYGTRGGVPVVVSSGDGGWVHLGPHVAEVLASHGCFVVGLDSKAYLESLTSGRVTLNPADEPGDFLALARFAARGSLAKPVLVGVSEGAGLSVLAATDPGTKAAIAGVIALGLPDINELGWRWKDSIIYVTHGVPDEPTFSALAAAARMAPVPLAAIHSTKDEFVPVATAQKIVDAAQGPKRLWVIEAADHRFSNNLGEFDRRLLEALDWIARQGGGPVCR